jgi:hypothetical protein
MKKIIDKFSNDTSSKDIDDVRNPIALYVFNK